MPERDSREGHVWESGWGGHSEAQRRRLARLPLHEKLRWLEEAQRLILCLHGRRQSASDRHPPSR